MEINNFEMKYKWPCLRKEANATNWLRNEESKEHENKIIVELNCDSRWLPR